MIQLYPHISVSLGNATNPDRTFHYGITHYLKDSDEHSVVVLPGGNVSIIVSRDDATPSQMDSRPQKTDWHDIAIRIFNEGWNAWDDRPWTLSPVETYIYTVDGQDQVFFYGHSRTQSKLFPEIRLGYLQNPNGNFVIMDAELLEPEFMAQMGPDWQKWVDYSWAHIEQPTVGFNSQEWPLGATGHRPSIPLLD